MIGCALNVRERLVTFCFCQSKDKKLKENALTEENWIQLGLLHNTLQVFEISTMDTEGKVKSLWTWYPTLHWMLDIMDSYKDDYAGQATSDDFYSILLKCYEASWQKIVRRIRAHACNQLGWACTLYCKIATG